MSPTTTSTTTVTTTSSFASRSQLSTTSTAASSNPARTPSRPLRRRLPTSSRIGGSGISSISTPNLNSLYASQARAGSSTLATPPLPLAPPPLLLRKSSLATLTSSSLATIPDDTEFYALDTLKESTLDSPNSSLPPSSPNDMAPLTPARFASSLGPGSSALTGPDVSVGDAVDVPGGMTGVVRFVGSVAGRKGVFAGVELHAEFASRGKNNGDVDGVSYFATSAPGAGIFLPVAKALRRESPGSSVPLTPATSSGSGLKMGSQNSINFTPPTPSLPKFSQSVSGAGPPRAASPQGKRPRTSLPRPDSPVRRLQMTPVPTRPSISAPPPKPSVGGPGRFGSPTNKFSQSMRAPAPPSAGDPSKRGLGFRSDRSVSIGPRSASALGAASVSSFDDDVSGLGRSRLNGLGNGVGSGSVYGQRVRSPSRTANHAKNSSSTATDEEVERLRSELEDRERQLKDQANTLADMESSLTELQTLIEGPDGPINGGGGGGNRRDSVDDKDTLQLRATLREKNEKIAMLTAEFDTHRADFRSTIDTLEMASTETERVYEKKIEDMMQEIHELESRTTDVDAVAQQLKQLEELVQELEEGLEDARRGEAEARGEVEFLRGEVERTRTELQREREKPAMGNARGGPASASAHHSKELEQKDDEIRGLKAIIHSLSQNSGVDPSDKAGKGTAPPMSGSVHRRGESINERLAREKLERELSDLQSLLNNKTAHEVELERELEQLRLASSASTTNGVGAVSNHNHRSSAVTNGSRSSLRDSRGTVVLAREFRDSTNAGSRSPDTSRKAHHTRGPTLDTMPESDAYSSVTEASTLWCEICETNGHDILTCTNMFGPQSQQQKQQTRPVVPSYAAEVGHNGKDIIRAVGMAGVNGSGIRTTDMTNGRIGSHGGKTSNGSNTFSSSPSQSRVAPLDVVRTTVATVVPPDVKILPNPMESGPVAGKESGMVDSDKWCALCERDGHDSVDCPFEDAF